MNNFGAMPAAWQPLARYGIHHALFSFNLQTLIDTWAAVALMLIACCYARSTLANKESVARAIVLSICEFFAELVEQSLGVFHANHFAFITTLFCFIALCNILPVIPGLEEPTRDLNTTLAFGLLSFFYAQYHGVRTLGLRVYLREYVEPFFLMLPLHIIGKMSAIISISLRLFGNILGGSIIVGGFTALIYGNWWLEMSVGIPLTLLLTAFFIFFEGFLQAFIFTMLSLTSLSNVLQEHEDL